MRGESTPAFKNSNPTIGVLIDSFLSPCHEQIFQGVVDVAELRGVNVIAFTGGALKSVPFPSRNIIFNLINPDLVNGLILPTHSLARNISREQLYQFISAFSPLPLVSIGDMSLNIPRIVCKHKMGLEALLLHLIREHKYKRFAFIKAQKKHKYYEKHFGSCVKILKKLGITVDPRLLLETDFSAQAAKDALAILMDERNIDFDVIVTINDKLALSLINALKERGFKVPGDCAVVSCSSTTEGLFSQPKLTAVDEQFYKQGKLAANMLIDICAGKRVPLKCTTGSELIIRESCGCFKALRKKTVTKSKNLNAQYNALLQELEQDIVNTQATFPDTRPRAIKQAFEMKNNLNILIKTLIKQIKKQKPEDINGFLKNTFKMISNKLISFHRYNIKKTLDLFYQFGNNFSLDFNYAELLKLFDEILNIRFSFVSLFEDENVLYRRAKMIISYQEGKFFKYEEGEAGFLAHKLVPDFISLNNKNFSIIIEPVYSFKHIVGFAIFDLGIRDLSIYEILSTQLSTVLRNERQLQQLHEVEQRFSDMASCSSDWLWETDIKGCFTYSSAGVFDTLGYLPEEIKGKTLFEVVQEGEAAYINKVCNDLLTRGIGISNVESWHIHKEGYRVRLAVSASPIWRNDGKIVGFRGILKDITERRKAEEKIKYIAYYDPLTNLPNRTLFRDRFENALASAKREDRYMAIMFIDIDNFKIINENYGYVIGDQLIQKAAQRISKCIRETDTLARFTGPELILLLPSIKKTEDAVVISMKLLKAFSEPLELMGKSFLITISIGITIYPFDGNKYQALIKNAEIALNRAKEKGGNRSLFFDSKMEKASAKRLMIIDKLYKALKNNELKLFYQPQVDTESGKIVGVEALLRWKIQKVGYISPLEFLPIASETGLMMHIGEWVLKGACKQINKWKKLGITNLKVAINLSAHQFQNDDIVDIFKNIIMQSGIDPSIIGLEITENSIIENTEMVINILKSFKKIGMWIAIDDFGTGYSSLNYLNKLPVDIVKIDRSFIADSIYNIESSTIINTIISLVKNLGLIVIAEGVETREQLDLLKTLECDIIQGYYFYKPLPASEVGKLLKEHNSLQKDYNKAGSG